MERHFIRRGAFIAAAGLMAALAPGVALGDITVHAMYASQYTERPDGVSHNGEWIVRGNRIVNVATNADTHIPGLVPEVVPPSSHATETIHPVAVTDDGSVAFSYSGYRYYDSLIQTERFYLYAVCRTDAVNGTVPLFPLPGSSEMTTSRVVGASADGSVVVGSIAPDPDAEPRPFVWTEADGLTMIPGSPGSQFDAFAARAISADGSTVVGYWRDGGANVPFRWTRAGGTVALALPPGETSGWAGAVSDDGLYTVGLVGESMVRWTSDGPPEVLTTGPEIFRPDDVTASGQIIVGVNLVPRTSGSGYDAVQSVWTEVGGARSIDEIVAAEAPGELTGSGVDDVYLISGDGSRLIVQVESSIDYTASIGGLGDFLNPCSASDVTLDFATDVSDFFALASNFGVTTGAARADGDLTGDGAVDVDDFFPLASGFGCAAN